MNSDCNLSIRVQTERSFYFPGETVSGQITLDFESDFPGNTLFLKIKGKEETSWEEADPQNPVRNISKNGLIILYNHRFLIHKWKEDQVPFGQYSFPFSFILKDYLPGSCSFRRDKISQISNLTAMVKYMIKAECLSFDGPREISKIKNTKELIIREKRNVKVLKQREEITFPLPMMCYCIPQGTCRIVAYFEKDEYESGEEANVFCEIDNRNGSQDIENLHFELKNKVILRSDDQITKEFSETIYQTQINELRAKRKFERIMKIRLGAERNEELKFNEDEVNDGSSSGQLITSSYILEITPKVSGCLAANSEERAWLSVPIFKKAKNAKKVDGFWSPKIMEVNLLVVTEANIYQKTEKRKKRELNN